MVVLSCTTWEKQLAGYRHSLPVAAQLPRPLTINAIS